MVAINKIELNHNIPEDVVKANIPHGDWIKEIRHQKELWVASVGRAGQPDMNPIIFPVKDGKLLGMVVSPQCNKNVGLTAVNHLHLALNVDAFVVAFDSRMKVMNKPEDLDNIKQGDLARQSAYDPSILDCMTIHHVVGTGCSWMANLPYRHINNSDGSIGVRWFPENNVFMSTEETGVEIEGLIPDALKQIMLEEQPDYLKQLKTLADSMGLYDEEKRIYHMKRAEFRVLTERGYLCFDVDKNNEFAPFSVSDPLE